MDGPWPRRTCTSEMQYVMHTTVITSMGGKYCREHSKYPVAKIEQATPLLVVAFIELIRFVDLCVSSLDKWGKLGSNSTFNLITNVMSWTSSTIGCYSVLVNYQQCICVELARLNDVGMQDYEASMALNSAMRRCRGCCEPCWS